jgi:hypothetical protein
VFPDPPIGETTVEVSVTFTANEDITLATGPAFEGNDRFRMLTVNSMFLSEDQFDSTALRYEDSEGNVQVFELNESTPVNQHVFAVPDELGGWFEIIKTPGSTWFPDSPTLRVEVVDDGGLTLGIQGFLARDADPSPNDDNLSWFVEVLDAPDTIPAGSAFTTSYQVTAVPPAAVPEPSTMGLLAIAVGAGIVVAGMKRSPTRRTTDVRPKRRGR